MSCPRPGQMCYEYHCGGNEHGYCQGKKQKIDAEEYKKLRREFEEKCNNTKNCRNCDYFYPNDGDDTYINCFCVFLFQSGKHIGRGEVD